MTTAPTRRRHAVAAVLTALLTLALTTAGLHPANAATTSSTLTGKVVNADGSPAADHWVLIYPHPGTQFLATRTDDDGYYGYTTTPGSNVRILALGDKTYANAFHGGGIRLHQSKIITATDEHQTVPTITRPLGATVTMQVNDKREGSAPAWTIEAHYYDTTTGRWEDVDEPNTGQTVTSDNGKGGVRLEGLPANTPLRISITPWLQVRIGDTYPDWPYFYGGGKTFTDGPARAFPAGTTNLGTLDMTKLNPSVKHGLRTPKLSKTRQAYGHKNTATVTVTHTGSKTGTVTFKTGTRTLGTAKLTGGKATLRLPKSLTPGTHKITAEHGGDTSKAATLTVTKAKLTKAPTITAKTFTKGTRPKMTVTLGRLNNGTYPTGRVNVYVGKKRVTTVKVVKKHKGKVTITLPTRYTNAVKVKAKYLGNATTKSSTTKTITVKTK